MALLLGLGPVAATLVSAAVAYLLGGIPFALLVSRLFFKMDLREHGSGNLGATNAYRVLGPWAGVSVFALDAAKGAAAVGLAHAFLPSAWSDYGLVAAALAAILGHSYSPYLRFQGGKGVATAAGTLLVITTLALPILLTVFVLGATASRMISLGSVVAAAAFPILVAFLYPDRPFTLAFSFLAAGLVIWRHRANIGRMIRKEESKMTLPWSRSSKDATSDETAADRPKGEEGER